MAHTWFNMADTRLALSSVPYVWIVHSIDTVPTPRCSVLLKFFKPSIPFLIVIDSLNFRFFRRVLRLSISRYGCSYSNTLIIIFKFNMMLFDFILYSFGTTSDIIAWSDCEADSREWMKSITCLIFLSFYVLIVRFRDVSKYQNIHRSSSSMSSFFVSDLD